MVKAEMISAKAYKQREVIDKLGIKPGHTVTIINQTETPFDDVLGKKVLTQVEILPNDNLAVIANTQCHCWKC